jgi:hypothetical protein
MSRSPYREKLQMAKVTLVLEGNEIGEAIRRWVDVQHMLPDGAKETGVTVHLKPETLKQLLNSKSNAERDRIQLNIEIRVHANLQTTRSKLVELGLDQEQLSD